MAIIKCKMCGGELILIDGASTAECEFCGSVQTIPNLDDEKKLIQFERAERLRKQCEFDKAAGIYENIVADYRQEAEAYWGLVLCKYGIEYVDDPATGKKIPTCHRSSFDSVMDDGNFEQAMENADEAALSVYRQEAKQIETIRKGILEVSSNERPYDIFICYKETDLNGDRAVDSLLAQDIYDALTAKGYRAFFSRITLEDKLGQAYEPYIFAALNSARIMLAVGTCYEHYNAVWVKNEWSRYLKIIAQDKNKYLIPCYKNIDPYDIPKEFAHLQGQDMGKVGAIQDLLRGAEKILPKAAPAAAAQERVVVGGGGNNKIASLLDRGNMALEDGDWAKADSFFEDVLNNDSKNAQAYLGKTLAQERCRTIDAFARKRKDATRNVGAEKLFLERNTAHVEEKVNAFSIPRYVDGNAIRSLYVCDLSYSSQVAQRRQQYQNEESFWANHKWLSRAEKFALGAVAENLAAEKKALFAALSVRVKKAEAEENAVKEEVRALYAAHLQQADEQAEALYRNGCARREADYENWLNIAKTSADVRKLTETAQSFAILDGYRDSKALAEHCRKRAAEEQSKLDAEKERRRILREQQEKERKKKAKRITLISLAAAAVVIAVIVVLNTVVIPSGNYKAAEELMADGKYTEAILAFEALDGFSDSKEKIEQCRTAILDEKYHAALTLMEEGRYEAAAEAFAEIGDHQDSHDKIQACHTALRDGEYAAAAKLMEEGQYESAIAAFEAMDDYKDSLAQIEACRIAIQDRAYTAAVESMNEGAYEEAMARFDEILTYKDSAEQKKNCMHLLAKQYEAAKNSDLAITWYEKAGEQENADAVRYAYVTAHKNSEDTVTYRYLKDLKQREYKDATDIYASLYKLKVKLFINTDRNDTKTSLTKHYLRTSKGYQDSYAHFQVTEGPPSEDVEVRIYYETRWGTNDKPREPYKKQSDSVRTVTPNGEDNVFYFNGGSNLYYHRITIYDAVTGEKLAQKELYRPYEK